MPPDAAQPDILEPRGTPRVFSNLHALASSGECASALAQTSSRRFFWSVNAFECIAPVSAGITA